MYQPKDGTAPRVSVVMPVYNAAAFLGSSIGSVQAQGWADWELLAVDDGSTDGSAGILDDLAAADPRIRALSTGGNQGAGVARNLGMDQARGRFVAFLDADDQWHPDKLSRQLAAMAAAELPFSCTAYLRRDLAQNSETLVGVPPRASRQQLLKTNTVACSTAVFDRAHFAERRMSTRRRRQDFLFWLDLLQDTPAVLGLPQVLMTYHQHSQSLSAAKGRAALDTWAMYRQGVGLSPLAAAWYFGNYALRGLMRHRAPGLARAMGVLHRAEMPESLRS